MASKDKNYSLSTESSGKSNHAFAASSKSVIAPPFFQPRQAVSAKARSCVCLLRFHVRKGQSCMVDAMPMQAAAGSSKLLLPLSSTVIT
jgi:hypothetical protein